jgi:phosphoenolpyruvate carboxykinase (ATP)
MTIAPERKGSVDLTEHGISASGDVLRNPTTPVLYEHAVRRGDARIAHRGPFVVDTGKFTGRSPKDKFAVEEPQSKDRIWWTPGPNGVMAEEKFEGLRGKVADFLSAQEQLYVVDAFAGADPKHRISLRVITYLPYHALFARTMFIIPTEHELESFEPEAVVLHVPGFEASPEEGGTRSGTFCVFHPTKREILIGGTYYAGEIKKSIFTLMNDSLPLEGVLPMHCSANVGTDPAGDVAIFFGLSGTGKTTLSADPERRLIGDDEHGWGDTGVFNIEGGCYAKTIRLSREAEPDIWLATNQFGTVLENVTIRENGRLDFDDDSKTENTRAAYKLERLENVLPTKMAGHPENVVFLTADAFGILPPIARLDYAQARYYFLSGFTSKLAGTEIGVTEPEPTFSTCFGSPFLPQRPEVYSRMLGEKLDRHRPSVWLVNTGWTGGPYGEGHRMPIQATRALLHAALGGRLDGAESRTDETFGFEVPVRVPGVDSALLDPRSTWRDPEAYDRKAKELAQMFRKNFEKFPDADDEVKAAGPKA